MQDMVPGLAVEEFSTPPSSPAPVTKTVRKTRVSTTDSFSVKAPVDLPSDVHDIRLGK